MTTDRSDQADAALDALDRMYATLATGRQRMATKAIDDANWFEAAAHLAVVKMALEELQSIYRERRRREAAKQSHQELVDCSAN